MEVQPIIKLNNIDVFQNSQLVLSNVNLEVKKGEFVFLIGATGSGKSSLLKIIYKELDLKTGIAQIAGYDLLKLKTKDVPFLRRKLGIVFQDFQLLMDRSVEKNLEFVMKATGWKNKDIKQRVDEVLDMVGMRLKAYRMPHELSGGEQQRIVIARALINHPEIILADEPTGHLDPDTSVEIMNLLKKISETGTAVLMATHDYSMIKRFPSRIVKFNNGVLTEEKYLMN
jgi:cell division transport system ATP-binding protein